MVEFTRPLQDQTSTKIPDTVTFDCELSTPELPVEWFYAGRPIKRSAKYSIAADGCTHKLTVKDVDGRDAGEYSIEYKTKSSTAKLIVECELHLKC